MRLRKCADELSQIADAMASQMAVTAAIDPEALERRVGSDARRIAEVLAQFGVNAKVEKVHQGPTLNEIEVSLPPGCHYSSVTNIADELQGVLKKRSVRIEAPIPGSDRVGIEYDRSDPEPVTHVETTLPEIARLDALRKRPELPVVVGMNVDCGTVSFDLATLPHLLIGGAAGQGKTMFIHGLINGLVSSRSPEEVRLILFDPKRVEFSAYANLPHLVVPVLTENAKMVFALHWAVAETERRLKTFAAVSVRNIQEYNHRENLADEQFKDIPETLPHIVIVLDELADLMQSCGDEVLPEITRLTIKARAAGIHLVIATQRPESDVVTGVLKANIPGRITFKTVARMDSRVLLDDTGAERLIGKGDCLYRDGEGVLQRVQVPFISDAEIAANVERAIARYSAAEHRLTKVQKTVRPSGLIIETGDGDSDEEPLDQLVEKAKDTIRETGKASISHFQRLLGWGFNKAAKVVDELEKRGIVGPERLGPREVFFDKLV